MHLLLNEYNKILYSDNNVFTNYTYAMKTWNSDNMVCPLTLSEDYIYVGAPHTFASRFIKIAVANDVSASLTVEFYAGNSTWLAVKNLNDGTRLGALTLAQSGFISWDLPSAKSWVKNQINGLPELDEGETSQDGKGMYWMRIKASATLKATTAIDWLGLIWTDNRF